MDAMNVISVAEVSHMYFQKIVMWIPRLVSAIIILLVFWGLSKVVKKILLRLSRHAHVTQQSVLLIAQIVKGTILVVGIISAMGSIGIDVTALITGLGVTGFAVSFAMKDIISNSLSGLLILVYQPFKVGGQVSIGKASGIVQEINMRHTVISSEGNTLLIPNAKVLTDIVTLEGVY